MSPYHFWLHTTPKKTTKGILIQKLKTFSSYKRCIQVIVCICIYVQYMFLFIYINYLFTLLEHFDNFHFEWTKLLTSILTILLTNLDRFYNISNITTLQQTIADNIWQRTGTNLNSSLFLHSSRLLLVYLDCFFTLRH